MMVHLKQDRDTYIRMEFRRFMNGLILIPCRVGRRARSIAIRILGYHDAGSALQCVGHH